MECSADKVVLEVNRFRNLVFGKVLQQPDTLKPIDEETGMLVNNPNNPIIKHLYLGVKEELGIDYLRLRGRASTDQDIFYYEFASVITAKQAVADIRDLIVTLNDPDVGVEGDIIY